MSVSFHPDNAAQAEFWGGAGGARWAERQDYHDRVLRPVTDLLLAAADARRGERVIDVGCGGGAMTAEIAAEVAPDGDAVGLDISGALLTLARARAPAGLPVRFEFADATIHELPPERADLVVSRFGVMFFADPARAFMNLRRGLRAGGRIAFACWREANLNPYFIAPLRAALKHAPPLPETGPEDPGPFSLADEARVRSILGAAGFAEVRVTPHDLTLDVAAGQGLDAAVAAVLSVGPTSRMLQDQSEAVRAAAAADIQADLRPYARGDAVLLGGTIWIVTAKNPWIEAETAASTLGRSS